MPTSPKLAQAAARHQTHDGEVLESGTNAENLVLEYLGLANSLARRFSGPGRDPEDLLQIARVGLVKAARSFDPRRGVPFVGYAAPTILGELKRSFRDGAWVIRPPRAIQELHGRIVSDYTGLTQQLGREPSIGDLARHLETAPEAVSEAVVCGSYLVPLSIDEARNGIPWAETLRVPEDGLAPEDMIDLDAALDRLSPLERRVLRMRYFHNESQQAIGDQLGMSQVQVSRLLVRVLAKLREMLAWEQAGTLGRSSL
ncbi:RNA polymerase sigma factor SigF [Zafaria cholistanensis]|uniref:RNA polymerase sigma factor SigF n=1 Tax=Zafaria cholistanensis TaxID=1682741 RepID=A0A5A7NSJ0_9MICC|nr:sigma-70 family RNA polymerase sigma factor [Zafaria cholistanensis]GER23122.1 RNA polymerase sigma factor SigF [Zafaria cholistanensis]